MRELSNITARAYDEHVAKGDVKKTPSPKPPPGPKLRTDNLPPHGSRIREPTPPPKPPQLLGAPSQMGTALKNKFSGCLLFLRWCYKNPFKWVHEKL